jgi:hypothetical protein
MHVYVSDNSNVLIPIVSKCRNMNENLISIGATIGGGFFAGAFFLQKKEAITQ